MLKTVVKKTVRETDGGKIYKQDNEATQKAWENWSSYVRARDTRKHKDYLSIAEKSEQFYIGNQWTTEDLKKLKEEGRPALTINMILPTINSMIGEQTTRRIDLRFKPGEDGDPNTASALTKIALAIKQQNNLEWLESRMFTLGLVRERAYYDVRMNWDNPAKGRVDITLEHPSDVIPDPDAKDYNPNTWNRVFVTRWYSVDEIANQWGKDKAKAVEYTAAVSSGYGDDSLQYYPPKFGDDIGRVSDYDLNTEERKRLKTVRVVEQQYFQYRKVYYLVHPETGEMRELKQQVTNEEAQMLAQRMGMFLHRKMERRVRWTISADNVLLFDGWSPYRSLTIIPFFSYFIEGTPFGPIRNLFSPQEQLNKISSQELHIINTTANSGWVVEQNSLANMTEDELRQYGSKSGITLVYRPGKTPPQKIKPNSVPSGHDRITQKSIANIKIISGISDAMLGTESPEVSGVALEKKQNRGLVQQAPIKANLDFTRYLLGKKILELVQDFYTETREVQYIDEYAAGEPQETVTINEPTEDGYMNDPSVGSYDVVVSTMPSRDNFEDEQFAQMLNMRNIGIQIPDYRIAAASNLRDKAEISQELQALAGLTPPSEEEQAIAQQQQELQNQMQMLQLAKVEQEVNELAARAQLQLAKAQTETESSDTELTKIEAQLQMKREELELRKRLAALSAMGKLDSVRAQSEEVQKQNLMSSALRQRETILEKSLEPQPYDQEDRSY